MRDFLNPCQRSEAAASFNDVWILNETPFAVAAHLLPPHYTLFVFFFFNITVNYCAIIKVYFKM